MYLRYETTWYALPLLMARIRERMDENMDSTPGRVEKTQE
jgi:hypothetical protein